MKLTASCLLSHARYRLLFRFDAGAFAIASVMNGFFLSLGLDIEIPF